ncbi:MAG: hypothetical protein JWO46_269 [Nocardioidaceae bacterium]|nr:hypothetical protein [Nocardioidaceae bacterium]
MGNHRADKGVARPAPATTPTPGGRRKAEKQSVLRKHPLTGLPMIPTMAGAVAVSVAAGGAMSAGITEASAEVGATGAQVRAPGFSQFDTLGLSGNLDDRQR